jgi:hypothetical protein
MIKRLLAKSVYLASSIDFHNIVNLSSIRREQSMSNSFKIALIYYVTMLYFLCAVHS